MIEAQGGARPRHRLKECAVDGRYGDPVGIFGELLLIDELAVHLIWCQGRQPACFARAHQSAWLRIIDSAINFNLLTGHRVKRNAGKRIPPVFSSQTKLAARTHSKVDAEVAGLHGGTDCRLQETPARVLTGAADDARR